MMDTQLAPQQAHMGAVELPTGKQSLTVADKAAAFDVMAKHELRCMTIHGMLTVTNRQGIVVKVPAKAQPTPAAVFHHALMLAAEELAQREQADNEPETCADCSGSGEGMYEGTRCSTCKGSGVEPGEPEEQDFPEREPREWTDY